MYTLHIQDEAVYKRVMARTQNGVTLDDLLRDWLKSQPIPNPKIKLRCL